MSKIVSLRMRSALFASTALLALPANAYAGDGVGLSRTEAAREAYGAGTAVGLINEKEAQTSATKPNNVLMEAYGTPAPTGLVTEKEPEILIANPNTPTTARDPANITGIGQMIIDQQNGFIGLCTGTLINPRTVLFAAHCVNSRAANTYGAGSGGVPIAFGFETNTRANAAGQPDELLQWFSATSPTRYRTNIAQAFYNANYVAYDPRSLEPNAASFLYADVAIATLDTPAANVPTWAMLFSALPARPITAANGAGYHVSIAGYGNNGTGQGGTAAGTGIDFRRRLAENFIGGLASLDQFENFLFGGASTTNPQNLYWIDFDDPRRGTASASVFDFNAWRDNSVPNGQEGITSQGDSGGPLILDQAYSTKLILGVLSGGYTRFFNGQPANSYGTAAFYQPLYLYWDWISANNGYHYVASVAGTRDWTDSANWISSLDPNYYVLNASGQLVNGVPNDLGTGPSAAGNVGTWGQACFQTTTSSECQDMRTGAVTFGPGPIGTVGNNGLTLSADALASGEAVNASGASRIARDSIVLEREAQATPQALPPSTIANGLPGAVNFVPNNFDGNRLTSTAPRYFDVTMAAAGTTTLGSTVVIDRFKISGAQTTLNVAAAGSLTSLMDISHLTGIMQVNGNVRSIGDYFFLSGLLTGTGTVRAPFLTSVMGNFAPGTQGTIGTLTVGGNLVMGSASTLAIDIGSGGTSDRLAVIANGTSTGIANVGGRVLFAPATGGGIVRAGDLYTILTATGGVTGTFTTSALSAILTPQLIYNANSVQARLIAGSYSSVVANTPVQRSFAALLDRNRGGTSTAPLFDFLDLQNAATIQATLESWAPRAETLKGAIGTTSIDNMNRFFRGRLAGMDIANGFGGTVATLGNPLQTVSRMSSGQLESGQPVMGYGQDSMTEESSAALPDTVSVFFAGGYLDGKSSSMATAIPFGGDDNYDGYYAAAGVESELGDNAGLGFALSYTDIDGTTGGSPQGATGKLYQGTIYGKLQSDSGLTLDTQLSAAMFSARTERTAVLGPTTYNLRSKDDALALSGEIGLSKSFDVGSFELGPRVAARGSRIEFTPTVETGGPPALSFDRGRYDSLQGLAGLTLSGGTMKFRPYASAYYVHEFEDKPASFGANFVGGVGLPAAFALTGTDKDWFEASAGIAFGGENFEVALAADTTIGRSDVENQSYRGTVTFRF